MSDYVQPINLFLSTMWLGLLPHWLIDPEL